MKKLENKVTSIDRGKGEGFITFADLIRVVCDQVPQGGLSVSDMRERIRILSVIEEDGDTFDFEDADAIALKRLTTEMRWSVISKDIIMFVEDVERLIS